MTDLSPLLGQDVTVTGPRSNWSGRLIALAEDPSALIQSSDGRRLMLPQSFHFEPATMAPNQQGSSAHPFASDERHGAKVRNLEARIAELSAGCGQLHSAVQENRERAEKAEAEREQLRARLTEASEAP